jgi:peptide deformylase
MLVMDVELPKPELLTIRIYPHPDLSRECVPVKEVTPEIKELIQNMFLTMYNSDGVGLSANQVGHFHRIFVMDTSSTGNRRRVFINPKIISVGETNRWKEGCLSFPDIFAFVKRSQKIKISALNEDGEEFVMDLEHIDAVCFQHEIDHLDGIVFYDHLSPVQKNLIKKKIANLRK